MSSRTATLLLADMVGSTRLWEAEGSLMGEVVRRVEQIVHAGVTAHSGVRPVEQGEGDSFVAVFASAVDAVGAAIDVQRALDREPWPDAIVVALRMAMHTGEIRERDGNRVMGEAVNRCARLRDLGHGGQILVSATTAELVVDRLEPGLTLVDLGAHTLRDLNRPERVLQLADEQRPSTFSPLRSLQRHPNNLPAQLTNFIGRAAELEVTGKLLESSRLVTFVGPGGCGKTRLALQLAAKTFDPYPDGIWFVDLAPITDDDAVPLAFLTAIESTGTVLPGAPVDSLLQHAEALVVVDNCEHVIEPSATVIDTVLRRCPTVTVLATSREPLGVDGEVVWRVPSLSLPEADGEPDTLDQSEAAQLFVERASRLRPGFEVTDENAEAIAAICRRLEGMPLALELAAARVRVLPPAEIARGLDNCFRVLGGGHRSAHGRQQTLEASLEWSYRLLTEAEQVVLRRLGVFAGSFSLAAAEAVTADGDIDRYAVLDLVTSVVDKSLVVAAEDNDGARFSLLEPVRQFALLMLRTADEVTATRDRHTQYYVQRSRQAFLPTQLGDETWFRRVEADYDNFRTAISWALSADNRRGARWITSNLVFFWIWKRMMTEGARWLDQALGDSDWDRPEALGALIGGAFLSIQLGESERAKQYIDAGVTSARAVGDDAALGWGLQTLAMVDDRTGATHTPHALVEEVLALGEERVGTGPYLYGLGRRGANQWWRGELAAAEATLTDALQRARNEGLDQYDALYNEILCRVRADRGDFDGAEGAFRDAVDRRWQGVAVVTPMLYQEHGRILACRGDFDEANREFDHARSLVVDNDVAADGWAHHAVAVLFRAAADLPGAVEAVDDMPPALRLSYMERWQSVVAAAAGVVAIIRGNAEEARSKFSESLEAAQREQRLLYVPVAELGLAAIELAQGNPQKASARIIAALDDFLAMDARPSVVHALEEAASVAVAVDDHIGAARLFGAAKAERARIGYVEGPHVAAHYEPFRSTIRSALGEQAASAREEGRRMSLAEAVAYARGNRGPRRRPATGWDSLTPAELSVVRLVRDGLSNPRIAEQLFISTRTVTTHLTHVYTKLGITSRTELATAAVERGA